MIPYGRQTVSERDIEEVVRVLRSPLLTQGPVVEAFEQAVASYCGAAYGCAVNSGTAALHVACLALGIGPGDEVWTSPVTFVASANCALYCGARVDFVDVEPDSGNMSADALEEKLRSSPVRPKAVIVVHLAGMPCDMERIAALGREYGFKIIEDACHALGGAYHGMKVGCCTHSDITVFSFHPVKVITTGEGGMAVTRDPELAGRMRLFRSHGITRDPALMEGEPEGGWCYQQLELGFNYRMPEINAALGLSQLTSLDSWIAARNRQAEHYRELLGDEPVIRLPPVFPGRLCAWHIFTVRVPPEHRGEIYRRLREEGIGTNVHYIPVYRQPFHRKRGGHPLPGAEEYYSGILTMPLCPALKKEEQEHCAAVLKRLCREIRGA